MNAAYLAFAYLRYNWLRSLIIVLAAALILAVPLISQTILRGSEEALLRRANDTPLVLGNRGSQLDLVMNAVYFSDDRAQPITMAETETLWESGLGTPVPLHIGFETNGARIVGTSLDYFDLRDLSIADGRQLAILGEAVIGASFANRLGLAVGDKVVSAPENLFDLDGVYPLELNIVGVLASTGTPDDDVVFVDVKTAWVIAGIGHGHEDVIEAADVGDGESVQAAASLLQFNRITEDNIEGFHFHGDPAEYPISAVIVYPNDTRSGTMLKGRYIDAANPVQLVSPTEVIGELVDRIFRIKSLLDAVTLVIGIAALAAIGLTLFLGWRLRADEMQTAWRLGAGRWTILQLASAEILILMLAALIIAAALVALVSAQSEAIVAWLMSLSA